MENENKHNNDQFLIALDMTPNLDRPLSESEKKIFRDTIKRNAEEKIKFFNRRYQEIPNTRYLMTIALYYFFFFSAMVCHGALLLSSVLSQLKNIQIEILPILTTVSSALSVTFVTMNEQLQCKMNASYFKVS